MIHRRRAAAGLVALAALPLPALVQAQAFPSRPIRIIIPFAAGANSDVLTRMIAQRVTEIGGPAFIMENRPGGGGIIAAQALKAAPADGYTLLAGNSGTHAILPAIQSVPYDARRDFRPITQLFYFPHFLVVPARVAADSVTELVALAAASPGGLSVGTQGVGSAGHLLSAMFQQRTGARVTPIPYAAGGGPMNTDVVAGRLDMVFSTFASLEQHRAQGRVKFLAIASAQRAAVAPHVPTMAELGFPGVELDAWFGMLAPAGTPDSVVASLNAWFLQAAKNPELIEKFRAMGVTLAMQSSAEFAAQIERDGSRLGAAAKAAGIRID